MTLVSRVSVVYKQSEPQTRSDAWSITPRYVAAELRRQRGSTTGLEKFSGSRS
jgi:hypothetical protein